MVLRSLVITSDFTPPRHDGAGWAPSRRGHRAGGWRSNDLTIIWSIIDQIDHLWSIWSHKRPLGRKNATILRILRSKMLAAQRAAIMHMHYRRPLLTFFPSRALSARWVRLSRVWRARAKLGIEPRRPAPAKTSAFARAPRAARCRRANCANLFYI